MWNALRGVFYRLSTVPLILPSAAALAAINDAHGGGGVFIIPLRICKFVRQAFGTCQGAADSVPVILLGLPVVDDYMPSAALAGPVSF
jgi:hypothetical protein